MNVAPKFNQPREIVAPAHWNRDPLALLAAELAMREHRNSTPPPVQHVPIWTPDDEVEQEAWRGEAPRRQLLEG